MNVKKNNGEAESKETALAVICVLSVLSDFEKKSNNNRDFDANNLKAI